MEFIESFDIGLWNYLQALRQKFVLIDPALQVLRWLDHPGLLLVIMAAGVLCSLRSHQLGIAVFLLTTFAGGLALAWGTQELVRRERPAGINWLEPPRTASGFPSENTLLATVTYGALAISLGDRLPRRRSMILAIAFGLLILLGVSRLFLGLCYPTDVLGAWLGGASSLMCCRWIQERGLGSDGLSG